MIVAALRGVAVVAASLVILAGAGVPAAAAPEAAPAASVPCAPSDLALRQVERAATPSPAMETVFVLQNLGAAPCRISGGVGIRLFDAQGKPIELRFAVRNTMALLLTLAPGDEASFSISFAPHPPMNSVTAARIEVYLAPQLAPVTGPTTIAAYSGPAVSISNLRLGAVIPAKLMFP